MLRSALSNSSAPENETSTLTYRGVTYKVPENHTNSLGYAPESLNLLMKEELIYRGIQYKQASIYEKVYTSDASRPLSYRGLTYEIRAKQ